jgi:quinol monooxygenase YgiN
MTTMFARHKVEDYNNWKRVYDEISNVRKEKGVTAAHVYRDTKDPNTIIVTHQFKNENAATGFANSDDLKSAMHKAGVQGQPEFWFGEDLENTPY